MRQIKEHAETRRDQSDAEEAGVDQTESFKRQGSDHRRECPQEWNELTGSIIAAAMEVHSALGPGLLERLYERALCHELTLRKINHARQVPVRVSYKGLELGEQLVDMVVGGLVIVELKSVDRVHDTHLAQMLSYMRSMRVPLGLLINFNVARLKDGIYRRVHSPSTPIPNDLLDNVSSPLRSSDSSASSAFSSSC
jgi:GxxExxY protein